MNRLIVGVLALQGAFAKHVAMLHLLGATPKEIRKPSEMERCDGLIIPGGESTTIMSQIKFINFREQLLEFAGKKPLFGTCAGLILMSQEIIGDPLTPLRVLEVSVERNAFGRQAESFQTNVEVKLIEHHSMIFPALFIRAPRIRKWSPNIEVLAEYNKEPILVQQGLHLGATFHPELTENTTIHSHFLSLILKSRQQN